MVGPLRPRGCRGGGRRGPVGRPAVVVCVCLGLARGEAGSTARGVGAVARRRAPSGLCGGGARARTERGGIPGGVAREGLASRVRPSLPPSVGAFAPHAAARGGRGPWPPWLFFVSASPSPGRYPLRRRPAGRRGVRAPMRVTPGCCEFGEGEGLADPLRPGFPGGDPASVGCASRGLRVSKILHPRRPPLPPASRGPLRRFAGSSSRAAGCRLFPARLLALFFPRLGACPPFLTATSDQTWRPAEFKHISQRRKRN